MVSMLLLAGTALKAQNAIPSYNVFVAHKASFQEPVLPGGATYTDEKRDVNITNSGGGTNAPQGSTLTVYVYRLDQSIILGPYQVAEGQTISVGIDQEHWGVAAQTNLPVYMSVWISDNQ